MMMMVEKSVDRSSNRDSEIKRYKLQGHLKFLVNDTALKVSSADDTTFTLVE